MYISLSLYIYIYIHICIYTHHPYIGITAKRYYLAGASLDHILPVAVGGSAVLGLGTIASVYSSGNANTDEY